jgi:hyaluronan synthase
VAALLTYASIAFPFIAPFVVLRAVVVRIASGQTAQGMWFYLIGTYAMALLYSLYYAFKRHNGLWHHGLSFVAVYMAFLVFQTYWAMATMRDNRWGTRDSTVSHNLVDPELVTALPPSVSIRQTTRHGRVRVPARVRSDVVWEGGAA